MGWWPFGNSKAASAPGEVRLDAPVSAAMIRAVQARGVGDHAPLTTASDRSPYGHELEAWRAPIEAFEDPLRFALATGHDVLGCAPWQPLTPALWTELSRYADEGHEQLGPRGTTAGLRRHLEAWDAADPAHITGGWLLRDDWAPGTGHDGDDLYHLDALLCTPTHLMLITYTGCIPR